jgi:hypothetical protein
MDDESTLLRNISALLEFGVDPKTFRPWFSFAALTELLTVRVNGLVYMDFSRAWACRFCEDSNVMEVRCECRHLSDDELDKYGRWRVDAPTDLPKLTIITVEGDLHVNIICESYDIVLEPLSQRFPYMVDAPRSTPPLKPNLHPGIEG